ncbi:Retrotransposon-derived protein PEG10 [Labeo rohita]|uniref:Retrotransposon-derived protein PEG10 n=1 Tax=Labeo rohita TaxID=84645 RepID=A0ABQ8LK42_LABRO|nr:Retrotransposon-derived protein PEG10 [Labeo rohita]
MGNPVPISCLAEDCNGFLLQCSLALEMQLYCFTTEQAKISFIISLLTWRSLQWAETIWAQAEPAILHLPLPARVHQCSRTRLNLLKRTTKTTYKVQSVTGTHLSPKSSVHFLEGSVQLRTDQLHTGQTHLLVLEHSTADVILGHHYEPVPCVKIYPLSFPEQKAMEEYIEALFRLPCSQQYPQYLHPRGPRTSHRVTLFTKLNLCSAHNPNRICEEDEWKTAFETRLLHIPPSSSVKFLCYNISKHGIPNGRGEGTKNVRHSSLSSLEANKKAKPILPSTQLVNPIQWSQDQPTSSNASEASLP